ncbi:hypothetical protein KP509_02G061200 [Ceratopteris richardii]|uniref:Mitochondrial ATP synthase subunit G protein n=1 Tax=Ceratopteris richardii TaxID=49495 RepID=A0A8T2VAC6_CERRI|nr:hypothetical protein KP509_02G061200 [Ceratopteris richardii]
MAANSLIQQLRCKTIDVSQMLSKRALAYYKELLEKNDCHIARPPTTQKCSELSRQLFYTRLASLPARYDMFCKEVNFLKQKAKCRQDLKIEELGVATLFAAECYAWFCVGEIVGRGFTFTGYYV